MDVKNLNVAWICNYEVMVHLQNIKDKKKSHRGQQATITYEALKYLESSACGVQLPNSINKCLKALQPYNLSKSEMLMMINHPPTTPLDIQLLINKSQDRLSDVQVDEILHIVQRHLIPYKHNGIASPCG